MRLALIFTGGLHPSGREEVIPVFVWLLARLARTNDLHAFVLRHLPGRARYSLAGATVHDLGRPVGHWAQWRALHQDLSAHGPFDLIHGFWADPAGVLAAIAGRRLGLPSVVTCDTGEFTALPDLDYGLQLRARSKAIVQLACRLATQIHVTSGFMEARARALGWNAVRIPIGVDLDRIATPCERAEGPPWRLLQVASLNRVKDQSTLLQAIAFARRSLDVRLDLVGEDVIDGRLQKESRSLGIADAVSFHGFVPHDDLARFHRAAHLYVQSSQHEGGGVAVLEAAAAGVPIVGTRVGHLSDLAPDGAVAVAPRDAAALADAIVTVLRNPDQRRAMATVARQFVVAHDIEWSATELGRLYESLIERGDRGERLTGRSGRSGRKRKTKTP